MPQIDVEKINSLLSSAELLISLIRQELNSNKKINSDKEIEVKEKVAENDSVEYITPYSDEYDEVFAE